MWSKERHQRILKLLNTTNQVSAGALADMLMVSRETIRRDLVELEIQGDVRRVHGGAVLPGPASEEPFKKRLTTNPREKREIARKAAALIEPGQCIMVDAGTTTSVFAHELTKAPGIMVITNSIDVASIIKAAECDIELILLGGQLISDVPGTFGELTLSEIQRFNADHAFVAPVALHPDSGAFDFDLHEAEVARAMIAQSGQVNMLVVGGKLGTTSRVSYCPPERIDVVITDEAALKGDMAARIGQGRTKIV